jgi:hypothetical protein
LASWILKFIICFDLLFIGLSWSYDHSFKTRPGPVGWPGTRQTRGWNRAELKKKQGKEKLGVTRRPGKTRSKTWLQLVDFFFFFTKTTPFWFFFKKNWPGRTRSKPRTRALDWAGSKNYAYDPSCKFNILTYVVF